VFWSGVGGCHSQFICDDVFRAFISGVGPDYSKQSVPTYASDLRTKYAVDLTDERVSHESGSDTMPGPYLRD